MKVRVITLKSNAKLYDLYWMSPAFRKLLNNYEVETGRPEKVTEEEQIENCHFIDLVVDTDVMREAHQFLVAKGKAPEGEDDFKRLLYDIWFRLYRRSRDDK